MQHMKTKGLHFDDEDTSSQRSLQKGILVNALSPHPYLFWLTVGGPTTIKAMNLGLPAAISFVLSFYVLLVGAKIVLAVLVGKTRSFLLGNTYVFTMRTLGLIMIILAAVLFRDGLQLLGLL
jgi:threonine/homoserine/homoserine lactone efflux protein